jgi:hypothetical protein
MRNDWSWTGKRSFAEYLDRNRCNLFCASLKNSFISQPCNRATIKNTVPASCARLQSIVSAIVMLNYNEGMKGDVLSSRLLTTKISSNMRRVPPVTVFADEITQSKESKRALARTAACKSTWNRGYYFLTNDRDTVSMNCPVVDCLTIVPSSVISVAVASPLIERIFWFV